VIEMKVQGYIQGLHHQVWEPVQYFLQLDEQQVALNDWLDQELSLSFLHEKACIHCGRKVKKTYNNGYCYPCFRDLAENDLCIVKPHECHFHLGTCRDEAWAEVHCMTPHIVYLALSSDVKVGITRKGNSVKRWIDQGAIQAIPIAELPTRKMAGELEAHLSQYLPDKTNWRRMLAGELAEADLFAVRDQVREWVPEHFRSFLLDDGQLVEIMYPMLEQIQKIRPLNLDKQTQISGRLVGIKGQYLIFEHGVFHVKKHSGYKVAIEA